MTDQFAFLKDKCKAAIASMSLAVLLLLPASLGFGGTIMQEAFGQLDLPSIDGGEEDGGEEEVEATLPSTTSTFLLRGIIASILPTLLRIIVVIFWLGDGEYL
jgi:hypothetical protein